MGGIDLNSTTIDTIESEKRMATIRAKQKLAVIRQRRP